MGEGEAGCAGALRWDVEGLGEWTCGRVNDAAIRRGQCPGLVVGASVIDGWRMRWSIGGSFAIGGLQESTYEIARTDEKLSRDRSVLLYQRLIPRLIAYHRAPQ